MVFGIIYIQRYLVHSATSLASKTNSVMVMCSINSLVRLDFKRVKVVVNECSLIVTSSRKRTIIDVELLCYTRLLHLPRSELTYCSVRVSEQNPKNGRH